MGESGEHKMFPVLIESRLWKLEDEECKERVKVIFSPAKAVEPLPFGIGSVLSSVSSLMFSITTVISWGMQRRMCPGATEPAKIFPEWIVVLKSLILSPIINRRGESTCFSSSTIESSFSMRDGPLKFEIILTNFVK